MATCGKIDKYKREVCVVMVDGERKSGSNGSRHGLVVAAPPSPVATCPGLKAKPEDLGKAMRAKPNQGWVGRARSKPASTPRLSSP